jgi:hypothetical protein
MNLVTSNLNRVIVITAMLATSYESGPTCFAAAVCDDDGGNSPYVCVDRSGATPVEDFDFRFDFVTDPANPKVTLLTGNTGWVVWSQVSSSDTTAANLGAIEIDPSSASENFSVTVANGALPGAKDVGSMDLTAVGWTGFSSLSGGEITGNLTGDLILKKDAAGSGGELTLAVGLDVSGEISVPAIATMTINGDVVGDITTGVLSGIFDVSGDVSGDIRITEGLIGKAGTFHITGDVDSTSVIEVADFPSGLATGVVDVSDSPSTFAGTLLFTNGLPAIRSFVFVGRLTGTIDLNGKDLLGSLTIDSGSGTITGGAITGGLAYIYPQVA